MIQCWSLTSRRRCRIWPQPKANAPNERRNVGTGKRINTKCLIISYWHFGNNNIVFVVCVCACDNDNCLSKIYQFDLVMCDCVYALRHQKWIAETKTEKTKPSPGAGYGWMSECHTSSRSIPSHIYDWLWICVKHMRSAYRMYTAQECLCKHQTTDHKREWIGITDLLNKMFLSFVWISFFVSPLAYRSAEMTHTTVSSEN